VTLRVYRRSVGISADIRSSNMTATSQSSLTLRLSRLISSADCNPVAAGTCAGFCLLDDNGGAFLHARFSFPSPGMRGFLSEPIDSWHVS
jgi:hypothetical protein